MEYEFSRWLPSSVAMHTSRMPLTAEVTEEFLDEASSARSFSQPHVASPQSSTGAPG